MRVVFRRLAWVGIAIGVVLLGWALLVSYDDSVAMLKNTISAQGQSPNPAGSETFSCPALREDAAEFFFAEVYAERRPCQDGRESRERTANASLAIIVLSASVLVGEWASRPAPGAADPASPPVSAML